MILVGIRVRIVVGVVVCVLVGIRIRVVIGVVRRLLVLVRAYNAVVIGVVRRAARGRLRRSGACARAAACFGRRSNENRGCDGGWCGGFFQSGKDRHYI